MKEIKRDIYLNKLVERKENNLIKIVTGIRRSVNLIYSIPFIKIIYWIVV